MNELFDRTQRAQRTQREFRVDRQGVGGVNLPHERIRKQAEPDFWSLTFIQMLAMTTFAANCSDEEIRKAVAEWSELLAQGRYEAALGMFPHTSESFGFEWTPKHLEDWISNYGCARKDYDSGEYRKVTSLFEQADGEQFIRKAIKVDREHLFGLDPKQYVGMVHYDDVPLDGEPSDLTARFHIKRVGEAAITLEFLDIHVM